MKLRIILFSFISLSVIASEPAQAGKKMSSREVLIKAAMRVRPVTPIPPERFKEARQCDTEEGRKVFYHNGEARPGKVWGDYDEKLAKRQLSVMNESRKAAYDAAVRRYKAEMDIYNIERQIYLELLQQDVKKSYGPIKNAALAK
ncbi:MAG TPA: hypothetical protein VLG50_00560 [Candidatus Saccharimonadales bacterium]|nr:hypothetical protein [Candidatus Saccharimonadales bacterium]